MQNLTHFARTPPGIKRDLVPGYNDLMPEHIGKIKPEITALYEGKKFIYAIPKDAIDAWFKSGQLQSLLDYLVKLDWQNYSVEQWNISTQTLPMEQALVRESYYGSPASLGIKIVDGRPVGEGILFEAALPGSEEMFIKMLNTTTTIDKYRGDFINPELLLPFVVPLQALSLEKRID